MQSYWDLTEKQRAALTGDTLKPLLKIEMMQAGVVDVPAPVLEELESVEVPTETFFQVEGKCADDGSDKFDCFFRTAEIAQEFMALQPLTSSYDSSVGYDHPFIRLPVSMSIVSVELSTQAEIARLHDVLASNEAKKKRNKSLNKEYQAARKIVEEATERLYEDWNDCGDKARLADRVVTAFTEYQALADGDTITAMRFLAKIKTFTHEEINAAFVWAEMPHRVPNPEGAEQAPAPEAVGAE